MQDWIQRGLMVIKKVPTASNISDLTTKQPTTDVLQRLREPAGLRMKGAVCPHQVKPVKLVHQSTRYYERMLQALITVSVTHGVTATQVAVRTPPAAEAPGQLPRQCARGGGSGGRTASTHGS